MWHYGTMSIMTVACPDGIHVAYYVTSHLAWLPHAFRQCLHPAR
jgi:hypothetical protein